MPFSIYAADLLVRIPLSAHTVLDVGCGDGDLLAAYRKLNPRARLLGAHRQAQGPRRPTERERCFPGSQPRSPPPNPH